MVLRLIVFWPPHITQLRVFDATVSAPSSIPFVSWAVDTFMVFISGWLPLLACAPPLRKWPCVPLLRARPAPSSAPGMLSLQWPPSEMLWRAGPLPFPAACRVWLMIFTSLGAQGPFRAHLIIQTLNFLILATRGTCFCDSQVGTTCLCGSGLLLCLVSMCTRQCWSTVVSPHEQSYCVLTVWPAPLCPQLLTAPLMEQRAAAMHSVLAALASLMLPGSHMLVPASARGRCWALLLLLWSTMGWLLPTLVMLPMKAAAVAGQREGQAGELAAAAGQVAGGMHRQETAAAGQEAGGEQRQGAAAGGTANCWAYKVRTSFERALMSALCTLEPSAAEVYPWAPHPEDIYLHPRLLWVLRWWVLISIIWAAACVAAGN